LKTESPIFSKCFDLILWIDNHTEKFPKNERFRLAKRIEDSAYNLHSLLIYAAYSKTNNIVLEDQAALAYLYEADIELKKLQFYFRIANKKQLSSSKQYEFVSEKIIEMGKLLGGWIKKEKQ